MAEQHALAGPRSPSCSLQAQFFHSWLKLMNVYQPNVNGGIYPRCHVLLQMQISQSQTCCTFHPAIVKVRWWQGKHRTACLATVKAILSCFNANSHCTKKFDKECTVSLLLSNFQSYHPCTTNGQHAALCIQSNPTQHIHCWELESLMPQCHLSSLTGI